MSAAAAAKLFQSCPTLCNPIDSSPPGSPIPGIHRQKTGVGCHFLLQCMKVKSESEVPQSCPTLNDPMDCSLPASSAHGIFQARVLEWGAIVHSTPMSIFLKRIIFLTLLGLCCGTQALCCSPRASSSCGLWASHCGKQASLVVACKLSSCSAQT